jgi:hypothetical protein
MVSLFKCDTLAMDKSTRWPQTRGLCILGIAYGLGSNNGALIQHAEFFVPGEIQSQLANWCEIEDISYATI